MRDLRTRTFVEIDDDVQDGFLAPTETPSRWRTSTTVTPPMSRPRLRLIGVASTVLVLNILGWGLFAVGLAGSAPSAGLVGVGVLAFVLGVRHAFDADHIATIDDCSRLLVRQGKRPLGLGLFFALGHSGVVLILVIVVILFAGAAGSESMSMVESFGGILSAVVAATFLLIVGVLNLKVFRSLWLVRTRAGAGTIPTGELDAMLKGRGVVSRILGRRVSSVLVSSPQMIPIGFLFGLGLGTASEVALLGLSATSAATGSVSKAGLLALPFLFAAGMALFDTANSLIMVHMYSSAVQDRQRLRFNLSTTLTTGLIGIAVGLVYLAGLLVDHAGMEVLAPIASIGDHFEVVGYIIVAAYLAVWLTTVLVERSSRRARVTMVGPPTEGPWQDQGRAVPDQAGAASEDGLQPTLGGRFGL